MEQAPKQIADAVLAVMHKVGYVQKKGVNKFHDYKYASIEGVLEKVQPALVEAGLIITQDELGHDVIAESQLMEARYAFSLTHKDGATFGPIHHTGLANFRNTKGGYDDKALNKCHTAARKYFILGLFQIPTGLAADPDDDEDKPAANGSGTHVEPPQSTMTGRKNEAEGIKQAREWANNAHIALGKLTTRDSVQNWIQRHGETVEALANVVPDEYRSLKDKIDMRLDSFNTLAAG
jgi:hypothetical protein